MTAPTLIGPVLDEVIDHLTIVELEQHLDEDVPCLVGELEGCEHAAQWAVRCPACGLDWTACDDHRRKIDGANARMPWLHYRVCAGSEGVGCEGLVPCPINWRPL